LGQTTASFPQEESKVAQGSAAQEVTGSAQEERATTCRVRWKIETFHKILKSGYKAEEVRLRAAERIVNLIAILCSAQLARVLDDDQSNAAGSRAGTGVNLNRDLSAGPVRE
jgi:hypothetical protein